MLSWGDIVRLVTVCEGVEDRSPVYLNEISGATIELILDATGKLGVLNSVVTSEQGCYDYRVGGV